MSISNQQTTLTPHIVDGNTAPFDGKQINVVGKPAHYHGYHGYTRKILSVYSILARKMNPAEQQSLTLLSTHTENLLPLFYRSYYFLYMLFARIIPQKGPHLTQISISSL